MKAVGLGAEMAMVVLHRYRKNFKVYAVCNTEAQGVHDRLF